LTCWTRGADAARTLLFAAPYALSVAGALRVWLVLSLALSAGACAVFFESALTVVVKDLFAASGLMAANSAIELASQFSLIAGPAIVALLAAAGGTSLALLANALTFAVSPESGLPGVPPGRARGPALARIRGQCPGGPALSALGPDPDRPHRGPDGGEPLPVCGEADHL
jgi:hypothetical protein